MEGQIRALCSSQSNIKSLEIVVKIYIKEITITEIENYTNTAFETLDELGISDKKKELLKNFGLGLMKRTI